MSDIIHRVIRKRPAPRTGRVLDAMPSGASSTSVSGGTVDLSNYVKKTGEVEQTVDGSLLATGELVAYADGEHDLDLPIASKLALGCVIAGDGINIDSDGTISAVGGGGIDGVNTTGAGNAITGLDVSLDGKTLNATKDTTFATSSALSAHTGDSNIHVTSTNKNEWNTAYLYSHTHSNKSLLDVINQGLSTSSNVQFGNITNSGYTRSSGDIIAYSTGSGDIDLPIASSAAFGAVKTSTGINNVGGTIKGTIHSVLNMANSSTVVNTYTSEVKIRSGYRLISGTVSPASFLSVVLYDCTLANTLSVTANVCGMNTYVPAALTTSIMQDTSLSCYRIVIYNPTSSPITLSDQRIYYTAIGL